MTRDEVKSLLESKVNGDPAFYFESCGHFYMGAGYGKYSYAYICCDYDNECGSNVYESYDSVDELLKEHYCDFDWEIIKERNK